MRHFQGDFDQEMAEARRRADDAQRKYDEEQDREYAKWRNANAHLFAEPSLFDQNGEWNFEPLRENDGRVSGFKVTLNGKHVAVVVPTRNDLVILMTDKKGDVRAHYRSSANIDAQDVMQAFVKSGSRNLLGE